MKISLVGYHGTSNKNASSIIKKNTFDKSLKNNEWLGHGVYFYELFDKADWWSKIRFKNNNCVLVTDIVVDKLHYCNLDQPKKEDELSTFITEIISNGKYDYVFKGNEDNRRCNLFNLYCIYKDIDVLGATLCSTNKKGKEALAAIGYLRTEKQYCVYNESCIKNIRIMEGDV